MTQRECAWWLILYCSAATNAASSPLPLLPPEIRSRIWDFVFSDLVVQVNGCVWNQRGFVVTTHRSSPACGRPLLTLQTLGRPTLCDPSGSGVRDLCMTSGNCQIHLRCKVSTCMLQVCRQVYQEAVLRPFKRATLDFIIGNW